MSLGTIFTLGVVFNMLDNITRPLQTLQSNVDQSVSKFSKLDESAAKVANAGRNIAMAGGDVNGKYFWTNFGK